MSGRQIRIALYSHDAMGIGHLRRNLLVARALSTACAQRGDEAAVLLVVGAREATLFALPPGADCLALPAISKTTAGEYESRSLHVALPDLVAIRSASIRAALGAFHPDVLIVDKLPRGVSSELDDALASLPSRTRCILGLRDILDDPDAIRREWAANRHQQTIRDHYDAVWVYGCRDIFDVAREYKLDTDVAGKVRYTGYLDRAGDEARALSGVEIPPGRLMLCVVGGGQDGAELAEAFAAAPLPQDSSGLVITGPFMPADACQRVRAAAARNAQAMRVIDFVSQPEVLLRRADKVVAMAGYNTICEILSLRKPALIVPRTAPRLEQWIRARRFAELGLVDMLGPEQFSPRGIGAWLASDRRPLPQAYAKVDFGGLDRIPAMFNELLDALPPLRARSQVAAEITPSFLAGRVPHVTG